MTANELAPFIVFVGLAFLTISAAVGAYVSSQRRDEKVRKRSRWIAASVWTLIAVVATGLFAIPVLDDFRAPAEPFREALLGTMVVWAICFCLWVIAVRRTLHALRKAKS
jgi:cytochrome bd-type quinol oxidase subunit 2